VRFLRVALQSRVLPGSSLSWAFPCGECRHGCVSLLSFWPDVPFLTFLGRKETSRTARSRGYRHVSFALFASATNVIDFSGRARASTGAGRCEAWARAPSRAAASAMPLRTPLKPAGQKRCDSLEARPQAIQGPLAGQSDRKASRGTNDSLCSLQRWLTSCKFDRGACPSCSYERALTGPFEGWCAGGTGVCPGSQR